MRNRPFVSIIVPAYQAEVYIRDLLLSLNEQDYPKEEFEIIVVVSGELAKENLYKNLYNIVHNLKIHLHSERLSAGKARNLGVSFAKGDILLFIDADCIAPPNWIKSIVYTFKEFPDIEGILGVYCGGRSLTEKVLGGELISDEKKIDEFPSFIEGNCAFKKIVFEKGCKFDDITYGEGMSIVRCMKSHYFKLLLDPQVQVKHLGRVSLLKYIKMGKNFYSWYLKSNFDNKISILRAFFTTSFVMLSLLLLILIPFFLYSTFLSLFQIPIHYFFIVPFLLVNIMFFYYIKKDYMVSKSNKIKYFPFLIVLRWFHQFGYFLGALKALSYL